MPTATEMIGFANREASRTIQIIVTTFRSAGASAGIKKNAARIQSPHDQRSQTDEQQKREHDARQQHSIGKLDRIVKESRRNHGDDKRGKNHSENTDGTDRQQKDQKHCAHKPVGGFPALFGLGFGQHRNERRRHGAFGKQFTKEIGNAECDKKDIGFGRGPKVPGQNHVLDISENAADERRGRHDARCPRDFPLCAQ
jgi:hypothetical protein